MNSFALAREFRATAAAACAAFPEELGNVAVCLTSCKKLAYVAPAVAAELSKNTEAVREAVEERTAAIFRSHAAGLAYRQYPLAGAKVDMIAVRLQSRDGHSVIFTFDHEIGHFVLKNGYPAAGVSAQKAECAADAFAMLRHIQRFGPHTNQVRNHAQGITYGIILDNDTAHYTGKALQKAVRHAKQKDISGLSLKETAKLAEEIADECAIEGKILRKIGKAFQRARRHLDKEMGTRSKVIDKWVCRDEKAMPSFCRETLDVMKKHWDDPDIFGAGRLLMRDPHAMNFMEEAAKTDPYWNNALAFIDCPKVFVRRKFLRHKPCF
jgi:hypothetical protein